LCYNPQQQQEQFSKPISALTVRNGHGSTRHGSNNLLPLQFKWRQTVSSSSGRSKNHVKFDVQNDEASEDVPYGGSRRILQSKFKRIFFSDKICQYLGDKRFFTKIGSFRNILGTSTSFDSYI